MSQIKIVYIAHPLRGNVQQNVKKVTAICKDIADEGKVIPLSPIHAFGFMSADGDQTQVMQYCLSLLSKASELWVFGKWQWSEGCRMEVDFALKSNIPIRYVE